VIEASVFFVRMIPHNMAAFHKAAQAQQTCLSLSLQVIDCRSLDSGKRLVNHFMHYNFARLHKTLRVTPAMEAGLSDHIWSLEEIVILTA